MPSDSLLVGFFYAVSKATQISFMCAVCGQSFDNVEGFQDDFRSHDMDTSVVSLPAKTEWMRMSNNTHESHEITSHKLDIPLATFVNYMDGCLKNSFTQTTNTVKSEINEKLPSKEQSEQAGELSDNEVTMATSHEVLQDTESHTDKGKWLRKRKVAHRFYRGRRKRVKRNIKQTVKNKIIDTDAENKTDAADTIKDKDSEQVISENEDINYDNMHTLSEFNCKECEWKSDRHFNYHRHMFTHSHQRGEVGPLVCDYCNKVLRSDTGKSGYGQLRVTCSICGTGPLFQSRLVQHMIKMHNITVSPNSKKPVYYCDQCPYATVKKKMYDSHVLAHQIPDYKVERKSYLKAPRMKKEPRPKAVTTHMCDQCPYTTNRTDLMKQHLLKHTPEDIVEYQCENCEFVAMTEKGLRIHSKKHRKASFLCPLCTSDEKLTYDENSFSSHLASEHHLTDQMFCDQCGKLVIDQQMLSDHMTEEHSQSEAAVYYVCYVCGVASDSRQEAKIHLEKHSSDEIQECVQSKGVKKPRLSDIYSCDSCEYRTDNPQAIRRHKLIHMKRANTTFSCEHCPETFNQLSHYNSHLMKVHQVKSFTYQCKMCGRMEQSSGSLKKHVGGHLKVKEIFSCDQCNYEAGRRWNLFRHKESTHKSQLYACDHCDYCTRSVPRIADHFRHVHLVEPPAIIQEQLAKEGDKGASLADLASKKRKEYIRQEQHKKRELRQQKKTVCEICGKLIINSLTEQHRNSHLGRKPFRCHYAGCQHETLTGSALAEHIRRRHLNVNKTNSTNIYSCSKCQYSTYSENQLLKHQLVCPGLGDVNNTDITEEVLTSNGAVLDQMQQAVMETTDAALLQQSAGDQQVMESSAAGETAGETVQIAVDGDTMLLIEQLASNATMVPQVLSQTDIVTGCAGNGTEVPVTQNDQVVGTLVTEGQYSEQQVTEVFMIIPTSDMEQTSTVIKQGE